MICKIADLITAIPEAGGLSSRCREYVYCTDQKPDVFIDPSKYRLHRYPQGTPDSVIEYIESGNLFNKELINHNGLYLHSSAIEKDGRAYLFSGPSGVGKSTHTRLWQQTFGEEVLVFNDDKPALRFVDDCWYAYGTPWCGKDGINLNRKVPLAGICFLKQSDTNRIKRYNTTEALQNLLQQTIRLQLNEFQVGLLLSHLDSLLKKIPVYELENKPETEAVRLSYETMRRGAEEAGL